MLERLLDLPYEVAGRVGVRVLVVLDEFQAIGAGATADLGVWAVALERALSRSAAEFAALESGLEPGQRKMARILAACRRFWSGRSGGRDRTAGGVVRDGERKKAGMLTILLIILIVLVLAGGFGYGGGRYRTGGIGLGGLLLIILLVLLLTGGL